MKLVFKIILILFPAMVFAKPPDSQVSKTINQSYYMTKGGSLDVINKYGQVVITSWDKDTVSFKIDITAFGKNRSDARKFLERVQIDFDKTSQYITAETIFDKN